MKMGFVGECMAELRDVPGEHKQTHKQTLLAQSFAGDVYNSAVYLKRSFPNIAVEFVSAVGNDRVSDRLVSHAENESIGTQFVARSDQRTVGLYQIFTDEQGERSFTYWRSLSAAKQMFTLASNELAERLSQFDLVMLSGITLAILEPQERESLWQVLRHIKRAGVKIAFDLNYRPALWESLGEARLLVSKASSFADILLPGIDDFAALYGLNTAGDIAHFCEQFEPQELVVKNGSASVEVFTKGTANEVIPIEPVTNVVDTTSAGDAFNGVYLGARFSGVPVTDAVKMASKCAAYVIQHHGAIVDQQAYRDWYASQF